MPVSKAVVSLINSVPAPLAAYLRTDRALTGLLRPIVNRLMPAGLMKVKVRSGAGAGLWLIIDARNEKFFWTGTHECSVQQALCEILKPGMVFWDVGANIGFLSLIASRCVGAAGRVHAFEPLHANRKRLAKNLAINGIGNVTIHDCALAASSGEAILHSHYSPLMWTLLPERGHREGIVVRCETLDEQAERLGAPDLIKVDTEGNELEVLRGGIGLLSSKMPALLYETDEATMAETRNLLPAYRVRRLDERHWLLRGEHSNRNSKTSDV
jgi:FkbM family methyltransferase